MDEVSLNLLSGRIIGACIEVHRYLGPGLLESVYKECLCKELQLRGLRFQCEIPIPIIYKGSECKSVLRADLVVENAILVELKSVKEMLPVFEAQIKSYLTLSNLPLGLLINFNVPLLKDSIQRIRLNYGKLSNHDLDNLFLDSVNS